MVYRAGAWRARPPVLFTAAPRGQARVRRYRAPNRRRLGCRDEQETNESKVVERSGSALFPAVALMDDDSGGFALADGPAGDQEFLDAYVEAHAKKFGEEFQVN